MTPENERIAFEQGAEGIEATMNYTKFDLALEAEGSEMLGKALELICPSVGQSGLTHYEKLPNRFRLTPYGGPDMIALPVAVNLHVAGEMMFLWLCNEAEYTPEPDVDGGVKKGWSLASSSCPGYIQIKPLWRLYGK